MVELACDVGLDTYPTSTKARSQNPTRPRTLHFQQQPSLSLLGRNHLSHQPNRTDCLHPQLRRRGSRCFVQHSRRREGSGVDGQPGPRSVPKVDATISDWLASHHPTYLCPHRYPCLAHSILLSCSRHVVSLGDLHHVCTPLLTIHGNLRSYR